MLFRQVSSLYVRSYSNLCSTSLLWFSTHLYICVTTFCMYMHSFADVSPYHDLWVPAQLSRYYFSTRSTCLSCHFPFDGSSRLYICVLLSYVAVTYVDSWVFHAVKCTLCLPVHVCACVLRLSSLGLLHFFKEKGGSPCLKSRHACVCVSRHLGINEMH